MKKICLPLLTVLFCVRVQAQSDYAIGNTIGVFTGMMSNSIKEVKIDKLKRQNESTQILHQALQSLKNDSLNQAYDLAEKAMLIYPGSSTAYLIMAYTALKNNDYLNSNRMLMVYDRYAKKKFNKNLSSEIPPDFISYLKEKSSKGLAALSTADLKSKFKKEPWLNGAMWLQLKPSYMILANTFSGYEDNKEIFPDDPVHNDVSLSYRRNFWLARKNSLPYVNNNIGFSLEVGVNGNFSIPNQYFFNNYKIYLTPGVFLNKVFFSPGQIRHHRAQGYNKENTREFGLFGRTAYLIAPEIRWYFGVLNAYSTDIKKLSPDMKSNAKFGFTSYVFFKYNVDRFTGENNNNQTYLFERDEILVGMNTLVGKNKATEFGCFFGPGGVLKLQKTHYIDDNTVKSMSVMGDYFRIGFSFSKRLF
jgi:hypothetical protein